MVPPAAAAAPGGGTWQIQMQMQRAMAVRAVAGVHVLLGLAAAAFAFHSLVLSLQAGAQGGQCAPTVAQVAYARGAALLVLQTGAAQAVAAGAAGMLAEAACREQARWLVAFGTFLGAFNAYYLYHVASLVVAIAVGTCLSQAYRAMLVASYVLLAAPLCVLLLGGLAIVL